MQAAAAKKTPSRRAMNMLSKLVSFLWNDDAREDSARTSLVFEVVVVQHFLFWATTTHLARDSDLEATRILILAFMKYSFSLLLFVAGVYYRQSLGVVMPSQYI